MTASPKLDVRGLHVRYGRVSAIRGLDLAVSQGSICAIIGPARSGKTSLLRTINLLSLEVDGAETDGRILVDGEDILRPDIDRSRLRRRIGMVFATPNRCPAPSATTSSTGRASRGCADPRSSPPSSSRASAPASSGTR